MPETFLMKLGAPAMVAGGVANVVFWLLAATIGSFVGASAALNPLWSVSQALHVAAAAMGALGLVTIYAVFQARLGILGLISFVIAFLGALCYFADGVIALAIFPALANAAPSLLATDGAINAPPVMFAFIAFSAISMTGYVAMCWALHRARLFPAPALGLLAAGAILSDLPPGPVPTLVIQIGGVLFGLGGVWLGLALAPKALEPARAGRPVSTPHSAA